MTIKHRPVYEDIYKVDADTDLEDLKFKYLAEHDRMTSLVLTKEYHTIVSVILGNTETKTFHMFCNGSPIQEDIDWSYVFKMVKKHDDQMQKLKENKEGVE